MGGDPDRPAVETFVDERGNVLRVRWHDEAGVAVVSIWRDEACVATVRLAGDDLLRLSTMITQSWLDGLRSTAPTDP